jgi:hypothetical protein
MTCSACKSGCNTSKNGICSPCRALAREPKGRRPKLAARRWLAPQYHELRHASSLRGEQIAERAQFLCDELRHSLPRHIILLWNLDNPYMSEDARCVMVRDVLRYHAAVGKKKPVASVRTLATPQRKKAA